MLSLHFFHGCSLLVWHTSNFQMQKAIEHTQHISSDIPVSPGNRRSADRILAKEGRKLRERLRMNLARIQLARRLTRHQSPQLYLESKYTRDEGRIATAMPLSFSMMAVWVMRARMNTSRAGVRNDSTQTKMAARCSLRKTRVSQSIVDGSATGSHRWKALPPAAQLSAQIRPWCSATR